MTSSSSSSSNEDIPLSKLSPRPSESMDEEECERLLTETEEPSTSPRQTSNNNLTIKRRWGAIWQVTVFTIIGFLIALGSGGFAYLFRHRINDYDFIHVPLPDLPDPTILRYFGGMGPWIGWEYVPPPEECKVTQLHMISRHGERYPTAGMGRHLLQFAQNISSHHDFKGALSFLNEWTVETDQWLYSPEAQLDQETLTGPAAGSKRMFTLGSEMRSRYYGLWDFRTAQGAVKVWASHSLRVIHSAKYFSSAFFGVDTSVEVEVIPETAERWGNSLTTTSSCPAFENGMYNASYGFLFAAQTYHKTFLPQITERMNKMSNSYTFTDDDILAMSELCPFQVNALGYSPFCALFSEKDWMNFNYARDLATYYASGDGNPYGKTLGQPWVETAINLMHRNSSTNHNLYLSFSHDTDIVPMISALGIFQSPHENPLPWDSYDSKRVFWTTSIVPMAGHILLERLACGSQTNVRVLVNGKTQPIPGCKSDESEMCELSEFERVIKARWEKSFCEVCAPGMAECVDGISFFEE